MVYDVRKHMRRDLFIFRAWHYLAPYPKLFFCTVINLHHGTKRLLQDFPKKPHACESVILAATCQPKTPTISILIMLLPTVHEYDTNNYIHSIIPTSLLLCLECIYYYAHSVSAQLAE